VDKSAPLISEEIECTRARLSPKSLHRHQPADADWRYVRFYNQLGTAEQTTSRVRKVSPLRWTPRRLPKFRDNDRAE